MRDKKYGLGILILAINVSVLSACGKSTEQADTTGATASANSETVSDLEESDNSMASESDTISDSDEEDIDDERESFDVDWPYPNVTPWYWEDTDPRLADIDLSDDAMGYFEKVTGGYTIQEVESDDKDEYVGWYWYLSIFHNDYGPYLSIYDCEAGNPGVEGYISYIDERNITVLIDYWYYEEMPKANWAEEDLVLELQYELTDDGIILTNGDEKTAIVGVKEREG